MITVKLYGRHDCGLCDQAKADLEKLQAITPHKLELIDVDGDPGLRRRLGEEVPVVEAGPYRLKAPFTFQDLQIMIGAAARGIEQDWKIEQGLTSGPLPAGYAWTAADRFTYWLARHYLATLNLLVFIYVGLPFLAPVFMKTGITGPAYLIYRGYGMVCHQMAFRSWFLFGEQTIYPRAAAGVNSVIPYGKATGQNENDDWAAREYIGNPQVGYKVAFCERDVSIYAAILLFGLIYAVANRKLPQFPWYLWVLIGLVPIGLDGGTQLISQLPLSLIPYRESTPFLRALTGGLFGFTTAWFGYPMVEETMADTRRLLGIKLTRLKNAVTNQQSAT